MMEKNEPTLVPQWLRSNGSVSGNGTSSNPLRSSLLLSDDYGMSKVVRKNSSSSNDQNLGRSSASERIKSSYFRRSSNNNSSANLRTSSSLGRSQRDRDWNDNIYESGNKDRAVLGGFRGRDYSDSLGNNSSTRVERKSLRRSHSMISDQRGETWPRKVETGSKNGYNNTDVKHAQDKGLLHKVSFERDFPSLGVEEKLAASEIRRVPSPSLSSSIHSFAVAAPAMMGNDKWMSALAEVPGMIKSHETGISSAKVAAPGSPYMAPSISTGLSMAETVAQGPPRVQTPPQLSTESQRQELAIKQSRQLIPVTPSLPKALISNPLEKPKFKTGQPHVSHSPHAGSVKPDPSKTSNIGKLQVLKPVREKNGASLPAMENSSPTSDSKTVSSLPAATHSIAGSSSVRAQVNNSGHPVAERKHVLPLLEKRPTSQSQTRSRNDFFSLMRKKSISNSSPAPKSSLIISATGKKLDEGEGEGEDATSPVTNQSGEVGILANIKSSETRNVNVTDGDSCNGRGSLNSKKNGFTCNSSLFSEEEEAAFLRSLGWEENTEEGGLTEEEINAFYKDVTKYINSKPSWKILQGMPRFLLALESQIGSVAGISSGLNSSNSKLEL
ncbi:hypothetical protein LIER_09017 [Lithospermum erythrorhizon]|uniref:Uncharacterized protein n=1 Tax=Lithospermum erythrorhizon TaxID=34254 RepID=A0AAV3PFE8_LITER